MGCTRMTSRGFISVDFIGSRAIDKNFVFMGWRLLVLCFCCCAKPVCSIDKGSGPKAVTLIPEIGSYGPLKTLGLGQLPEGQIRKIFLIFKPKDCSSFDFWDYSPSCLQCTGSPEKRQFVIDGLAHNYAIFVPESLVVEDGDWGAWPEDNPDIQNVLAMFSEWKTLHGLENLPTVALGPSAGGFILATLGLRPGFFESIAIMICRGLKEVIDRATSEYPPVLFVHMPKDAETANYIANARRVFESKGIITGEARWYEHPLTPDWYSQLIPGVDLPLSMKVVDHFRDEGWLDERNMIASTDFQKDWYGTTRRWNLTPQQNHTGVMLDVALYEETMIAYARHKTFARKNPDMFAWFEGAYRAQESSISSI